MKLFGSVPSDDDNSGMLWPFSVVELRLGRDLVLREGVHRHLRDRDPAGEGAGTGLELRGWRSCSGAGSLEADTGPGDIAKPDTVEDTVTVRTVMEEDIGRRDPDPGEEDRKLAGTKGLAEGTHAQLNFTYRISSLFLGVPRPAVILAAWITIMIVGTRHGCCLLYTSDAADEMD